MFAKWLNWKLREKKRFDQATGGDGLYFPQARWEARLVSESKNKSRPAYPTTQRDKRKSLKTYNENTEKRYLTSPTRPTINGGVTLM